MNTAALTESVSLHNGVSMPKLGLGTWKASQGGEVEQSVRWALELGYRHIDTAAAYGNEEGVGKAIRESGIPRDEVFVTTKLANPVQRQGYEAALRAIDESLGRLGMDHVDLYLIHWPVKGKYPDAWRAMEAIYESGKAKAVGVSNFMIHHLEDLRERSGLVPMVNQVEFHPRLVQPALLDYCNKHGIQHEAWSPLMQGGELFGLPELQPIAERHGKTVAQVVLRWDLQKGTVTIPKSVHRERLAENGAIFDFQLSDEEVRAIDALDQGRRVGPDPDNFNF